MWHELQVFLLAMTPVGELRVAIPVGVGVYHLNWFLVFLLGVLGNLVPVALLLLFFNPASKYLSKKFRFFKDFFIWLFEHTKKRHQKAINEYGWWGLMVFVAIPLPMTGGWTGSLIAFMMGMKFKRAFSAIGVGVVVAGLIVTLVVKTGLVIEQYLGWQVLTLILLLASLAWIFSKSFKYQKNG
ncbi:MAG: small multi-drug export protein [Candidatus Gribaldobacteria bacterium]|nr:small multi-drug export protein [Candidatus Gribaldobacteria bacterium]